MSPRQTGALTAAFLMLAGGVWINALWLQTKPQRAMVATPQGVTPETAAERTPAPGTTLRISKLMTDSAPLEPELRRADPEPALIRALQDALVRAGYGPLFATGTVGPQMRAAILAYEYDHHLPLTAEATEALLRRLGAGETAAAVSAPDARRVRSQEAERVVRVVQQSLTSLGFPPGRIDGRLGDETSAAILAFEQDQRLPRTGRISAPLFTRLAAMLGARGTADR
jgi:peptidoglycan hydrolase-like protein with peptidoglycan-binding domain